MRLPLWGGFSLRRCFGLVFFVWLIFPDARGYAEDWRLRGAGSEKQQQKALQHLKKHPFSHRALSFLQRAANSKARRRRLERHLEQGLQREAGVWWRWVVWGRWNFLHRKCGKALGAFVEAEKIRADWRLCTAQAESWVCSGEDRRGLEQWLGCLKKAPRQAKQRVTMGAIRLALKLRATKELATLVKGRETRLWTREGLLSMARELAGSGYAGLSLEVYEELLRRGKVHRARYWKEASEVALHAGALKKARMYLRQARGYNGPHWWRWELYGLEERIARREGGLRGLYMQRKKVWGEQAGRFEGRLVRRWMWLARIAEELSLEQEMLRWDRRILKHRPRALRPRIRLLRYMQRRKDEAGVLRQIEALIQAKHADAAHIAFYVQALLKRSGRPRIERWHASWAMLYRGLMCYHRQPSFWMHYSTQESFGPVCYKSSREDWSEYRQRRWDFWWRYEAKESQKKDYQRGRQLLLDSVKRFSGDFRALRIFERWLVWLGEEKEALAIRRRMVGLSIGDNEAFFLLERMFRDMGAWELWRRLTRLHLQDRRLTLEGLGELLLHLQHAYVERLESMRVMVWNEAQRLLWRLEGLPKNFARLEKAAKKQRRWASVPCVWLLRSIASRSLRLRKVGKDFLRREKASSLASIRRFAGIDSIFWRVLAVYERCGGRGALASLHRRVESLSWGKDAFLRILQIYVQMDDVEGVKRVLKNSSQTPVEWVGIVRFLLQGEVSAEVRTLLSRRSLASLQGRFLAEVLLALCQEPGGCPEALGSVEGLLRNEKLLWDLRVRLLGAMARTPKSTALRLRVLEGWESSLKKESQARQWLLSHAWVFLDQHGESNGKLKQIESRLRALSAKKE